MRRRQGLCPSRCYDTRRTPEFILQEVKLRHRENISKKNVRNLSSYRVLISP